MLNKRITKPQNDLREVEQVASHNRGRVQQPPIESIGVFIAYIQILSVLISEQGLTIFDVLILQLWDCHKPLN